MSDLLVVEARGLAMDYGSGELRARVLHALDLDVARGEFVAILGRSGSGKSTLLHLLGAIDRATGGTLRVGGVDLGALDEEARARFRRRHVGFVFQAYNLLTTLTVAENLRLPLRLNERPIEDRVDTLLARLGLADKAERYADRLSGGEQQRVAIARALIHDPLLVLADEPTGNLDEDSARDVLALFTELVRERGGTLVMATHSLDACAEADRVLRLEHGHLVATR
ncbi:MAG TPA: ABC transporter ATP-binding protein [Gammaproteobacteria bacterium]|nr:ABC transporter ATP-binding protein [Gammaproteobacteria bacterium]